MTTIHFPRVGISLKIFLGNIIAAVSVIAWYTYAYAILKNAVDIANLAYSVKLTIYSIMLFETVVAILFGPFIVGRVAKLKSLLPISVLIGVIASFTLAVPLPVYCIVILAILFSMSFGISLPTVISCFKDITNEENRAKMGSVIMLSVIFGIFSLKFLMSEDMLLNSVVLAFWRSLEIFGLILLKRFFEEKRGVSPSFILVLRSRSVFLYLFPWAMFSLINYLSWPISAKIYSMDFVNFLTVTGNVIAGISALLAGFAADKVGRKRTLIFGFIIFGLGYALLGINPYNVYAWQFYTIVDGIAWGIFYVIFLVTIWGDLAHDKPSEKFYAIGIIPYLVSNFLRETLGQIITDIIPEYAIFSFAALFLFLAVVPLMFAPETLPEKTLKERELRSYIEKAKRVREKFTKG